MLLETVKRRLDIRSNNNKIKYNPKMIRVIVLEDSAHFK